MFDLIPFERSTRNTLANYFNDLEKSFFSDLTSSITEFKTDILDRGDKFVLQAELPGFEKSDIHIDIDGDRLMIKAEHDLNEEKKDGDYVRRERRYGSFMRSFDISNIDADKITAEYKNGVLELDLPKLAEKQLPSRKVEIQ